MKNVRPLALLFAFVFSALALTGCTLTANGKETFFYERPAVGPQVEDRTITDVKLQSQSRLSLEAYDGIIKISYWDKDYLQIIENRKLKGPSSKKALKSKLEEIKCNVETSSFDVKLLVDQDKKLGPLFRRTTDIELMVPEAFKTINIKANSGSIMASGIGNLYNFDLELVKGRIQIEKCGANKIYASITDGNIDANEIKGSGEYKCSRGKVELTDVSGDIAVKQTSGSTNIKNADGRLDCDISSGTLSVKSSRLKKETRIYTSYGDIEAELDRLEDSGKYSVKAATGNIWLKVPQKTGWSLLAESTKGRIINNTSLASGVLETAPTGELYGDVGGGGPLVDVYIDRGDIFLN